MVIVTLNIFCLPFTLVTCFTIAREHLHVDTTCYEILDAYHRYTKYYFVNVNTLQCFITQRTHQSIHINLYKYFLLFQYKNLFFLFYIITLILKNTHIIFIFSIIYFIKITIFHDFLIFFSIFNIIHKSDPLSTLFFHFRETQRMNKICIYTTIVIM